MGFDISIMVGGEAGQGIQTVGDIIASVCARAGIPLMAINDFESRVRGGHNFFLIRISDRPVTAPHHKIDILLALNMHTYELHKGELSENGIIAGDAKIFSENKDVLSIPISDLSKEAGGEILSNTVAAGLLLFFLKAPFYFLEKTLSDLFKNKGKEIIEKNIAAARSGYDYVQDKDFSHAVNWDLKAKGDCLISGSKAIALGALASDCRFAAFYPMSPATEIMGHLTAFSESFPLVVEQAEDEIAAINMIIGASFAGVRSITATSGGGFCLMTEGLGLSGITETPIVIVNAQRPGPATGLPTRNTQADLHFVIRASQDEFPRFVFAPGSPEEAYRLTQKAFRLSEKYQVPVIILSDLHLNGSLFSASREAFTIPREIEGFIVRDEEIESPGAYKRFAFTQDGVSPRALPCAGNAIVRVSGNEHTEDGHISEDAINRTNMVNKRNAKIPNMLREMNPPGTFFADRKILLACWGSTKGAVYEASERLQKDGFDVGCIHFTDLWPFPSDEVSRMIKDKKMIMVEQNSTSQLGGLIAEQTGIRCPDNVLKYDGRPFYPQEIVENVKRILE